MPTAADVHAGFSASPKHLDDYFFVCDEKGSVLYDKICQTPAYYTYRSDLDVVKDNAKEIAELVGRITFVDFGCGMCHKSINLLEALHEPHAFIALDIESEVLEQVKEKLKVRMPGLKVLTHVADFRDEIKLPADDHKKLGLCTGSTISVHSDEGKVACRVLCEVLWFRDGVDCEECDGCAWRWRCVADVL